jgi:Asp-tRNA(Asn)/Glu-tRNA(Gln) amidotransferase A subunit family amidase
VPLALGTQHTASTLLPASFCGAFGFKPSSGFTGMRGSNILVPRLATIGFLARSVEDLALLASVFHPTPLIPPQPVRLAWVRGPAWAQVTADAADAFAALMQLLPASVEPLALPSPFERAEEITHGLLAVHIAERFGAMPEAVQAGYCAPLRELIAAGARLSPADCLALDQAADELGAAADGLFTHCDALITLSALGEATAASEPGSGAMCMPWSLAGLPAVSLPLLRGAAGLPIGVQLVGPRGADARLLSIAAWLTQIVLENASELA